jgi:uncharacterized protein YndB with AHSA1/START domain
MLLTVSTSVNASIQQVWSCWTLPENITKWNFATDDWHCPAAVNDLREQGHWVYTMAAKDGSFSFNFSGVYQQIILNELIVSLLDDGRRMEVIFEQQGDSVLVTERFEPESQNSHELQVAGWQSILNSFKTFCESLK